MPVVSHKSPSLWTRGVAARETLSYLDRRGIDARPALFEAGLSRRQLSREDIGLSVAAQYRFLELAATEPDDPLLGLHVAAEIAEEDGRIIGFLHLYERPAFDKPPEVIVQAIVVDQSLRGTGIGKTIMSMAERWAVERGFSSIALTSNVSRSGAHLFYDRLGYKIEATSHLFRRQLKGQNV
jgi:GNAT superfamily N-acetyltransferase